MSRGAPPGPGGLAAPGGGEAGAQGEGWARLPERTYCPGLGTGAPPGLFRPPQRRPVRPAAGSACILLGAKAQGMDPLLMPPPAPDNRPGPLGTRRGSRTKFPRSRRASGQQGRVWGARRKPGEPAADPPGPHPGPLRPTQRRRRGPAGPSLRAGAVSSLGTGQRPGPCALPLRRPGSPERPGGRWPGKCVGSALRAAPATSESARARARRASGACQDSLGCRPQPSRTPA